MVMCCPGITDDDKSIAGLTICHTKIPIDIIPKAKEIITIMLFFIQFHLTLLVIKHLIVLHTNLIIETLLDHIMIAMDVNMKVLIKL